MSSPVARAPIVVVTRTLAHRLTAIARALARCLAVEARLAEERLRALRAASAKG